MYLLGEASAIMVRAMDAALALQPRDMCMFRFTLVRLVPLADSARLERPIDDEVGVRPPL